MLVASELGQNQLRHARDGRIAVRAIDGGLEIIAVDRGQGLADVAGALDDAPRTSGSLGVGLGSVRRLSSGLDIDVRIGEGTRFVACVLDLEAPRRREIGIYGRPFEGEPASGDHAFYARDGDGLLVGLCDGLGHGPDARKASDAAVAYAVAHLREAPAVLVEGCHGALHGTRGVVMAVARIGAGTMDVASVGNVDVQLVARRASRRFGGSSAIVGGRPGPTRVRGESAPLAEDEVVLLSSDGIRSKLSIEADLMLLRAHPAVIAQRVLERFGRDNDDALVLVVR